MGVEEGGFAQAPARRLAAHPTRCCRRVGFLETVMAPRTPLRLLPQYLCVLVALFLASAPSCSGREINPEAGDRHRSMQSTLPTASLSMLKLHASIQQPNPPQDVLDSRMNWEFGDLEKRDQETIVYYPVGIAMWLHYMMFWNMYVYHGANSAIGAPPYPL